MDEDKRQNQTGANTPVTDPAQGGAGLDSANVENHQRQIGLIDQAMKGLAEQTNRNESKNRIKALLLQPVQNEAKTLPGPISFGSHVRSTASITSVLQLGQMIRQVRESRDLTQQEFADLAGVGRRFLSELENGKSTVEFGKVLQVAKAAGLDLFAKAR